jgi:hypothetical protein
MMARRCCKRCGRLLSADGEYCRACKKAKRYDLNDRSQRTPADYRSRALSPRTPATLRSNTPGIVVRSPGTEPPETRKKRPAVIRVILSGFETNRRRH